MLHGPIYSFLSIWDFKKKWEMLNVSFHRSEFGKQLDLLNISFKRGARHALTQTETNRPLFYDWTDRLERQVLIVNLQPGCHYLVILCNCLLACVNSTHVSISRFSKTLRTLV